MKSICLAMRVVQFAGENWRFFLVSYFSSDFTHLFQFFTILFFPNIIRIFGDRWKQKKAAFFRNHTKTNDRIDKKLYLNDDLITLIFLCLCVVLF